MGIDFRIITAQLGDGPFLSVRVLDGHILGILNSEFDDSESIERLLNLGEIVEFGRGRIFVSHRDHGNELIIGRGSTAEESVTNLISLYQDVLVSSYKHYLRINSNWIVSEFGSVLERQHTVNQNWQASNSDI